MKILFVGDTSPGRLTLYRAQALARLSHQLQIANTSRCFAAPHNPITARLHYRTGYRFLQGQVRAWAASLVREASLNPPDIVWVDHGELLGREAVTILRSLGRPLLVHNVDDPTGRRDYCRFHSLRCAIPVYDLCVVLRKQSEEEFASWGARAVLRVWHGYDEVEHRPFPDAREISERFRSDVVFVGTWIRGERRDAFLLRLAELGLSIAVWGDRWNRSLLWPRLRRFWRGHRSTAGNMWRPCRGQK